MPRAAINDTNLAFKDYGSGSPVLCLHGGMGIDSSYLDTAGIRDLASKNCRVIIFDQRGHGRSDRSDNAHYTHYQWIEDARGLAERLQLGKFVLLGHSYGGFLALEFALRWPETLSHLVLVCTSARPVDLHPPRCATDAELRDAYRAYWPTFFAGTKKRWDIFQTLGFSLEPYRQAFERALPAYDVRANISQITVPTLLLGGSEDQYLPDMQWLRDNLPHASLKIIQGAAHMPFIERPEQFANAIADFLGSATAS